MAQHIGSGSAISGPFMDLRRVLAAASKVTIRDRGRAEANTARYLITVIWADGSKTTLHEDDLASAMSALQDHP